MIARSPCPCELWFLLFGFLPAVFLLIDVDSRSSIELEITRTKYWRDASGTGRED